MRHASSLCGASAAHGKTGTPSVHKGNGSNGFFPVQLLLRAVAGACALVGTLLLRLTEQRKQVIYSRRR